jgi:hypothetical protein
MAIAAILAFDLIKRLTSRGGTKDGFQHIKQEFDQLGTDFTSVNQDVQQIVQPNIAGRAHLHPPNHAGGDSRGQSYSEQRAVSSFFNQLGSRSSRAVRLRRTTPT